MVGWRDRWRAVIGSDVSRRDGIGWEFTPQGGGEVAWTVFREDGGPFPVFISSRGLGAPPSAEDAQAMTEEAVADLLDAGGHADVVGWTTRNISTILCLGRIRVLSWEGEEWALNDPDAGELAEWAASSDQRVPFNWLVARTDEGDRQVATYQDDGLFGLSFTSGSTRSLPTAAVGSLRPRNDAPLLRGPVRNVEVAYDTLAEGCRTPGVVTEVLLHGEHGSTLLIAAEAYSRDDWRLYDESVVVLPSIEAADALTWTPDRRRWRPSA
ncbi:hypothetical protein [Arthrobacter sp. NEB 688]|uniref:hypothetical protein n=1 Tax=Arthrobacter sp. NEB 688 TaxID=904039 RepID=UPI001562EC70|nr:hypothetical protein [Arthrobacter sp. NEB 688]QKE85140.1 hypothetical protein HL663_15145 [Arthrobacter sp. NEB 688]